MDDDADGKELYPSIFNACKRTRRERLISTDNPLNHGVQDFSDTCSSVVFRVPEVNAHVSFRVTVTCNMRDPCYWAPERLAVTPIFLNGLRIGHQKRPASYGGFRSSNSKKIMQMIDSPLSSLITDDVIQVGLPKLTLPGTSKRKGASPFLME